MFSNVKKAPAQQIVESIRESGRIVTKHANRGDEDIHCLEAGYHNSFDHSYLYWDWQ